MQRIYERFHRREGLAIETTSHKYSKRKE